MEPNSVELTMGHDIGLSESYYRPTQQLWAVDNLTVNGDKAVLQKQVEQIKQETKDGLLKERYRRGNMKFKFQMQESQH